MSWSLRVGRILGIDVYIHVTFFLLLTWIVVERYSATRNWAVAANELLFVTLVFGIVVMHEYGHALTARRFGVKTRDITLLPIGGVARLERIPENPWQELAIAVAGPAVNVVLAILCAIWLVASGEASAALPDTLPQNPLAIGLIGRLFAINIMLVVFNMIPAFPMDGGRVLRSILAMSMSHVRATQIAARVGQGVALLFALVALVSHQYMLLLIAFFVWIGASQEAAMVVRRASLAGLKVRHAMITQFLAVRPTEPLHHVSSHILTGFQYEFPVIDNDSRVIGVISRDDLVKALSASTNGAVVGDAMQREFLTATPDEPLNDVLDRLQTCQCHSLPVLEGPQLVGLITAENIGEMLMIRAAAQRQPAAD